MPLPGKIIRVQIYTMETAVRLLAIARDKLGEAQLLAVCLIKNHYVKKMPDPFSCACAQ
jgi:hypothetical protein